MDADAACIDRLYAGEDLDGLQQVRGLVARVRDEMPGVEPPSAISAMLLQAARPARAGFWERLRSWFAGIAMHPGLAAAATLVIVAGAAAIWMRQGGKAATPTVASTSPPASEERATLDELDAPADPVASLPSLSPSPVRKSPPRKTGAAAGSGSGSAVVTDSAPPRVTTQVDKQAAPPPPPVADDGVAEGGGPSDADLARQLTRQAALAAKKHDCDSVDGLAKRVKALDPAYYAAEFVAHPDIAACRPVAK